MFETIKHNSLYFFNVPTAFVDIYGKDFINVDIKKMFLTEFDVLQMIRNTIKTWFSPFIIFILRKIKQQSRSDLTYKQEMLPSTARKP